MEIRTEYHKTQKALFRRVNQIRRANGICDFEEYKTGYRLQYCDSADMNSAFFNLKGKGRGAVGYVDYGFLADRLKEGLVVSIQHQEPPTIEMLSDEIETPAFVLEALNEIPESGDDAVHKRARHLFEVMEKLLKKSNLKDALDNAWNIGHYCNGRECNSIRTHHVMRLPGAGLSNTLPQLRLGGRWLERAGFGLGQRIQLITIKGMVLIVPIAPASDFEEQR